jgi:hypothetical protein
MLRAVLFLGVAVVLAAPAGAVVYINFDDMNSGGSQYGVAVGTQYQPLGIIFTNAYASDYWSSQATTSYPTVAYGESDCEYNSVSAAPVTAYFVVPGTGTQAPTDYVELLTAWADSGATVMLEGFDLNGGLVASDTNVGAGWPNATPLSISAAGIYSIKVTFGANDDVDGIDDLYFNAPVPEPTGVALIGLGVLGVAGRLLRRR